jgi:hypothetical protein
VVRRYHHNKEHDSGVESSDQANESRSCQGHDRDAHNEGPGNMKTRHGRICIVANRRSVKPSNSQHVLHRVLKVEYMVVVRETGGETWRRHGVGLVSYQGNQIGEECRVAHEPKSGAMCMVNPAAARRSHQ